MQGLTGPVSLAQRRKVRCQFTAIESMAMRWQYHTLKIHPGGFWGGKVDSDQLGSTLNQLGQQGWELCTSFETNTGQGASAEVVLIFKRPEGDVLRAEAL